MAAWQQDLNVCPRPSAECHDLQHDFLCHWTGRCSWCLAASALPIQYYSCLIQRFFVVATVPDLLLPHTGCSHGADRPLPDGQGQSDGAAAPLYLPGPQAGVVRIMGPDSNGQQCCTICLLLDRPKPVHARLLDPRMTWPLSSCLQAQVSANIG